MIEGYMPIHITHMYQRLHIKDGCKVMTETLILITAAINST